MSDPFVSSNDAPKQPKFVLDGAQDDSDVSAISAGDVPPSSGSGTTSQRGARPNTAASLSTSSRPGTGSTTHSSPNFSRPRPQFTVHSRTQSQLTTSDGITPPHTPYNPNGAFTVNPGGLDAGYAYASGATSTSSLPRVDSGSSSGPGTNPFATPNPSRPALRMRESFASPPVRPVTIYGGNTKGGVSRTSTPGPNATNGSISPSSKALLAKSTMLDLSQPLHKPWLTGKKDPSARIAYFLTYFVILLGAAAGAVRCWLDWRNVPVLAEQGNLCMVMDEDFTLGDDNGRLFGENGLFFREVDMSGFGNGEFEMTTDSNNNSFVRDGKLYILPTLTSDQLGEDAVMGNPPHIFNITDCSYNITHGSSYTTSTPLTDDSSDSSSSSSGGNKTEAQSGSDKEFDVHGYLKACSAVSNSTTGTIINPVQSARLSTRKSASIRYGKVEVRAKLPRGDWMWPAIWMLPVDPVYGDWPLSGEIDIMESRGNGAEYGKQGSNVVRGSLNWGPLIYLNSVYQTTGFWSKRRESYADNFHTYTMEWTKDWVRIYVDTRLHKMFDTKFGGTSGADGFWKRGNFPEVVYDNTGSQVVLNNPWTNGTKSAPFDIPFYLILNVAVGSTNGWFPDGLSNKPWLDGSASAMSDFIKSKDQWMKTWAEKEEDRAMVIDSVKMWQLC